MTDKKEEYTWEQHNLPAQNYRKVLQLLLGDLSYVQSLVSVVDPAEGEKLSGALVNIGMRADIVLPMLRAVLYCEFSGTKHAQTVLRAGSCATRMTAAYVRRIANDYLRSVIADTVMSVVNSTEVMEVDPMKLKGDNIEQQVKQNQQKLLETAKRFLDRITDVESIRTVPREIRTIAAYISEMSKRFFPQDTLAHVGGFVMLRFFNPAILAPEAFGLSPAQPGPSARRNLVLITKLLQNLANGVEFDGLKEGYMVPLGSFVTDHQQTMNTYLTRVANDGSEGGEGDRPDVKVAAWVASGLKPRDFALQDLVVIHRVFEKSGAKVLVRLQNLQLERDATAASLFAQDSDFFAMMKELGPSPPRLDGKQSAKASIDQEQRADLFVDRSLANILAHKEEIDTTRLDAARLFYAGPPSRAGNPVFYFVLNRLKGDALSQSDSFLVHAVKVMDTSLSSPFELVIDMSWACITPDVRKRVFTQITSATRLFTRKYKKNLKAVYIVNPSSFTRTVLAYARSLASEKFFRTKLIEIYDCKDLHRYIDEANLKLVPESRNFITRSYLVEKMSQRAKAKARLVKLTTDSMMVIDPKSNTILCEKLLTDISDIVAQPTSTKLTIKFVTGKADKRVGFFPSKKSLRGVADTLRFTCQTVAERDAVVEDIFLNRNRFEGALTQAYAVTKEARGLRHLERTCKLTADSVLFLEGARIKHETHYAGLERVWIDGVDASLLWIKYKTEAEPAKLQCENAIELVSAIKEGMFRFASETEAIETSMRDVVDDIYADDAASRERTVSAVTAAVYSGQSHT
eukprot:TRINITY_DN1947_c0_g1_i3.p1 TRINITY_DN1947_c0_g1~~TRINITY_DN1947_c0_g1_i3.p1  ORF type:complete len:801 (-),score=169.39 TRINITY_DN1947_c0_g1_i3:30-2432(-)